MPSKIQLDENLWFLYICLQKSDYKNIDFNAVGEVTNLKAPAARMRYTRLRRQIESGTLIGTHGTPFQRAGEKGGEGNGKRKRGEVGGGDGDDDEEEEEEGGVGEKVTGEEVKGKDGEVVKMENKSPGDENDSDTLNEEDEEEAPLANRTARQRAVADTGSPAYSFAEPQTGQRFNIRVSTSDSD
ncbi:hypothetical protein VE00_07108 [Pseudogymnoascus sp. WSF 3629]|nr:hypothetical protein VE00_07108 [Pseudogymnoascus sp. WSF 3629]